MLAMILHESAMQPWLVKRDFQQLHCQGVWPDFATQVVAALDTPALMSWLTTTGSVDKNVPVEISTEGGQACLIASRFTPPDHAWPFCPLFIPAIFTRPRAGLPLLLLNHPVSHRSVHPSAVSRPVLFLAFNPGQSRLVRLFWRFQRRPGSRPPPCHPRESDPLFRCGLTFGRLFRTNRVQCFWEAAPALVAGKFSDIDSASAPVSRTSSHGCSSCCS